MPVRIHPSWKKYLTTFLNHLDFIFSFDLFGTIIIPTLVIPGKQIFAAFDLCPWEKVQVIVLGQDPYHGAGQAHGLCFSVPDGIPHPPSLINIFKELEADIGRNYPPKWRFDSLGETRVLLLNAILTVRAHQAGEPSGKRLGEVY